MVTGPILVIRGSTIGRVQRGNSWVLTLMVKQSVTSQARLFSLSADGQITAIGANWNDGNGSNSGHVRIFQRVPSVSTVTDTISITVESVNDTPVWPPVTVSTNEDTTKIITLNATDVDSTTLTYAVTSQPSHGTVSIVNDKATYVPNTNFTVRTVSW